jgi:hypothetical protein
MLTVRTAEPEVRVLLGASPPIVPAEARKRVEEIWRAEKALRGDKLFNGRLFSVESAEPGRILGWLAEYKSFLAQRRDPSLDQALRVHPLAVTGLLLCEDAVVFARRADHAEQDAGLWELVPSGGVDGSSGKPDGSLDLVQQVLTELAEETGVCAAEMIGPPKAFAMVCDSQSHVLDVGIILRTGLSKLSVTTAFASSENPEHVALEMVPIAELAEFINRRGQELAGVSSALLDAARPLLASS